MKKKQKNFEKSWIFRKYTDMIFSVRLILIEFFYFNFILKEDSLVMNKTLVTSFAAASLLAVSSFSFAAAAPRAMPAAAPAMNHWYVGAGLNYNNASTENIKALIDLTNDDPYLKNELTSNIGFNLFAGNRLTQHWAVELGLNYLGEREYELWHTDNPDVKTKTTYDNMWNVYLDGIFTMPIMNNFEAFAKAGVNYFMTKTELDAPDIKKYDSHEFNSFGLNYGLGVQYNISQFGIRAGYTHLHFTDNQETAYHTPDFVYLDVLYHFA